MGMFDHLKPSNYGAESAADVGVFILGAAVGGIADGVLNFAGFAEPLIISGMSGAGALGLKKLLWDTPLQIITSRKTPTEREIALEEILLEIGLSSTKPNSPEHKRRLQFYELARNSKLDAEAIRRLWLANR